MSRFLLSCGSLWFATASSWQQNGINNSPRRSTPSTTALWEFGGILAQSSFNRVQPFSLVVRRGAARSFNVFCWSPVGLRHVRGYIDRRSSLIRSPHRKGTPSHLLQQEIAIMTLITVKHFFHKHLNVLGVVAFPLGMFPVTTLRTHKLSENWLSSHYHMEAANNLISILLLSLTRRDIFRLTVVSN